jgi:UPF0176 protein
MPRGDSTGIRFQSFLNLALAPKQPRPVHRLDANTSGLVLFARGRAIFAVCLQGQFLAGTVVKQYLVRVQGQPATDTFFSEAPISAETEIMGTRRVDEVNGLRSRTDFQVLNRSADGTALLLATLGTGRTNQIRVHLWHLGHPVVGDLTYLPGGKMGSVQTLDIDSPPLQLHAWKLELTHPRSGEPLQFETALPKWASGDLSATAPAS